MAWDFSTEPEFQEKLDWVEKFCKEEIEPLDLVFPGAVRLPQPEGQGDRRPAQAAGEGPGPVGTLLGRGAGRPGPRTAEARPDQRDPRPLRLGAGHLRDRRARHREHGDPRRLRHRRAEGALALPAHAPGDLLGLLDDRAPRRIGPEPVQDRRRARRRGVGHQRREVVHLRRTGRRPPVRDVHERHLHRAPRDAGRRDHAVPLDAQPHPLQRRAGARSTTCSGPRTARRCLRSVAWAAGASTTRCGPSPSASGPST